MKLTKTFFGFNLDTSSRYSDQIKVAINSCLKNTNLEIFFLYCGAKNELYEWLESKNVNLINTSDRNLLNLLKNSEGSRQDNINTALGAWQRIEVSNICKELSIEDEHVLYTDVDVIFNQKFNDPINNLNVNTFACSREGGHAPHYNSGVMIMNTNYLRDTYENFLNHCIKNKFKFVAYDQGALNSFYPTNSITILNHNEWNLNAYMTPDPNSSRIFHFHGPKIHEIQLFINNQHHHLNPTIKGLLSRISKDRCTKIISNFNSLLNDVQRWHQ